jgi:hypothetical protein
MYFDPAKSTGVILFVNYSASGLSLSPILAKLFSVSDTISTTDKADINCSLSGIVEGKAQTPGNLVIYPNPASSLLTIKRDNLSERASIQLFSSTGQSINIKTVNTGAYISIDVSKLADELYLLEATDKGKVYRQKILVRH